MRVLLATDGSDGAAIAAELVKNIRWPLGSSIDVVRAVGDVSFEGILGPWPVGLSTPPDLEATALREAEDALLLAVEPLRKLGLKADHAVLRGRPADALLSWIDRHRPDLVIVGTRGDSELTQALVGSVSAELVDRSPVPVLVARRPILERVVVAVDGSDIASEAVAAVRRWPFLVTTTIRTLSVAPAPVMWWPDELIAGSTARPVEDRDAAADALLEHDAIAAEAAATLRAAGFVSNSEVRSGSPAQEIVAFAREWEADLVILGSRGRTGVARLLLGSVARNVLHHASSSVLVVRHHADPMRGRRVEAVAVPWTLVSTH
jgi:nucleotide-binding universal stress UspA family protein